IKAVAGGGGRGMRRVDRVIDFDAALASARREALSAFGDDRVLIERYVASPRHIEVQIFADAHGNAVHLYERDCSLQRRHQKVIEESPAPGLSEEMRRWLGETAVKAAKAVGYRGAGTVEFIADASAGLQPGSVFFIEMNTRLQVEHPVTEAITGLDLVEWQLRIAAGERLPLTQEQIPLSGHAIEARIYAEDPADGFRPSSGRLWAASFPSDQGIRIDSGVEPGSVVTPFYDAMLAKVIVSGVDRDEAVERLANALSRVRIAGPRTNLAFLSRIASHPDFLAGGVTTDFADRKLQQLGGAPLDPALAAGVIEDWAARNARDIAGAAPGPWSRRDGFQLGGLRQNTRMAVEIDRQATDVEIGWMASGPRVVLVGGARPTSGRGEIVWGEGEAFVLLDGRQLRVFFPDPLARELDAGPSSGAVPTPIHGRVVEVSVAPGQRVAKGYPLFTMEAMKMEHAVTAPLAGRVESVRIFAGQQVEQGVLAVQIEPEAGEKSDPPVE
ncbi:MAG: biotin/lipoyl-containing protein, partial [Propylenella sp.]